MDIINYKEQVLGYARKAIRLGLMAGTSGNLSARTEDDRIIITPSGISYETMSVRDIMVIDPKGNVLDGPHKPSSEWPLHAEIYRELRSVRGVVHTHSPYATAFAVLNEAVPVILVEMLFFLGGDIRVAPVAVPGTADVGSGALAAIRDRGACLLQNHGAVSVGGTLAEAFIRMEYAEDAAKVYHLAKSAGKPTLVPEDIIVEILNGKG
ncbi:MAG: class II aldolase/adducin family protein [Clostridiales bacterium]|nr:class II aldolase/adducin family protein [Clostridiales bacterium]